MRLVFNGVGYHENKTSACADGKHPSALESLEKCVSTVSRASWKKEKLCPAVTLFYNESLIGGIIFNYPKFPSG